MNIIRSLNLDVMIDDLPEIFTTEGFPDIKKITFGSPEFYSWQIIFDELFGPMNENFVKGFFDHMMIAEHAISARQINNGINSSVWKIKGSNSTTYAIKLYPDRQRDKRARVIHERIGVKFFNTIQPELRLLSSSQELDANILTWVDGKIIQKANNDDINEMVRVTEKLVALSKKIQAIEYPMAAEHCISLRMLLEQIESRTSKLKLVKDPLLDEFFTEFSPAFEDAKRRAEEHWPQNNKTLPLKANNLILSPSDFGFHNAIRKKSGKLVFLDFEYFGWDDPVKLYCDTLLHPGLKLRDCGKKILAKSLWTVFFQYDNFEERVHAAWPLFGLRWSLILLKSFANLPEKIVASSDFRDREEYLVNMFAQQQKALDIVSLTKLNKLECRMPGKDVKPRENDTLDARSLYLRELVIKAFEGGMRGHLGSSMSLIEILRILYDEWLKQDPKKPDWVDRDRCILSKGHGCLALYAVLADHGFFDLEVLDTFCHPKSILGGHPDKAKIPGIEASTGALGHGLSIGVGMALAAKIQNRSNKVIVITGDGEINEGSIWEVAMSASKHQLSNLTWIVDYNKLQSYGFTSEVLEIEPLTDKLASFGFSTQNINGHCLDSIRLALGETTKLMGKPHAIVCNTIKGKGFPFAEQNPNWHHKSKLDKSEINMMYECVREIT